MDEGIRQIVDRVKEHLANLYPGRIKRVILYGSHARGEPARDSDVDLLVLVDESLNPSEVRKSLGDLLFDILLDKRELVSVVVLPERFFEDYNSPFVLNVKREGVAV